MGAHSCARPASMYYNSNNKFIIIVVDLQITLVKLCVHLLICSNTLI